MSVPKHLRSLSEMEFYKNAIDLRKDISLFLLKDFNTRRNLRCVNQVVKNITEEEQKTIDTIFAKYGKVSNHTFKSEYPEWFIDFERENLLKILTEIVQHITQANSIYPSHDFEWALRREYQDIAITQCYNLYQELQYLVTLFPMDLNKLSSTLDKIEREVQLLKGWRGNISKYDCHRSLLNADIKYKRFLNCYKD